MKLGKLLEIRWHGRAGQGAKTAALVLAESVISAGKYAQAFPEYGPERMGAPMQAFDRISDEPILVHCNVQNPEIVVVLDESLISVLDVKAGVPENGIYIVNTEASPKVMREKLGLVGGKVFTVNATKISMEFLGKNIPNTPMIAALIKVTGMLDFNDVVEDTKHKLSKKFREEIVQNNISAMEQAYKEVASE